MSTRSLSILALASLGLASLTISQANAVPTQVVHADALQCDTLVIPTDVDEIGVKAILPSVTFPTDEQLVSANLGTFSPACIAENLSLDDFLIGITNTSGRDMDNVWYVANPETTITNFDGLANDIGTPITAGDPGHEAFLIDVVGIHRALVSESGVVDGIWQNGETWEFILQDYSNTLGIGPEVFNSVGVGDASVPPVSGTLGSSGSIIATPLVPEPCSIVLVLIFVSGLGITARRRMIRASFP